MRRTPRRTRSGRWLAPLAVAMALVAAAPAVADARVVWKIPGAGLGHGIGMSQHGAQGWAQHGRGWVGILKHYYRGTTIGPVKPRSVRVLLRPYLRAALFKGASSACGVILTESKIYKATRRGSSIILRNFAGRRLANCGAVLQAAGGATWRLRGKGTYRGALQVRTSSVAGRVNAINLVSIDDYVRGVISREMPSSWEIDALRAQAVAARSYALSTTVNGRGFDLYDDTRSQVYGGVAAETTRTNRAVDDTALNVVKYGSAIAVTFFSSTSGGHTENIENVFIGAPPKPYLRGVPDPYDSISPFHRWRVRYSHRTMQAKLGGLVKGRLKTIRVTRRGVSPRVVRAKVIGTAGVTRVTGPRLQSELGLMDTWMYFRKVVVGATSARAQASAFGRWQPG